MPYMDLSCGRSIAPNTQSSPASWIPSNCIWTSANARFGCLTARNGLRRSVQCLTTKGRSSCSPARNASSPAGGTATTSPATTSSPEHRAKRSYGSIASGAAKGDGICTAFSPEAVYSPLPAYAELHCLSNFTFLRGASHSEELVKRAAALGYRALALTDECSLAGVVRAQDEERRLFALSGRSGGRTARLPRSAGSGRKVRRRARSVRRRALRRPCLDRGGAAARAG